MRRLLLILVLIFFISNIPAIMITEFESNPAGTDSGNEWIELYNKEEISLNEYKLTNNDGDEIILSGSFSGYFIYIFEKQWLDNSDEKVSLYKNEELIDRTDILDDSKNNDMTWQFCDFWGFKEATKGKENSCEEMSEEDEEPEEESDDNENPIEETASRGTGTTELQTIDLNPQVIKTDENKKERGKNYALYGFVAFCILIGILFLIKNRKNKYKNEFG